MIRPGKLRTWLTGLLVVFGLLVLGWYVFAKNSNDRADISYAIPVGGHAPGAVHQVEGFWVARQPNGEFYVFLDRDPHRGQPLNWAESKQMFMQAAVYRMDGTCQEGPCDPTPGQGLYRVESRLEGDTLMVFPKKVISGGFNPKPGWLIDLEHFLSFRRPSPAQRP